MFQKRKAMQTKVFDYFLPEFLIAKVPLSQRENARLLIIEKGFEDAHIHQLPSLLGPQDVLVFNDTKVIKARLFANTKGKTIEVFLLKKHEKNEWECLLKPGKKVSKGDTLVFSSDFFATVLEKEAGGIVKILLFSKSHSIQDSIESHGQVPIPPYIQDGNPSQGFHNERYQTVYASKEGAVAAPTAGLHFTKDLIQQLEAKGVKMIYVTLHVGLGTFRPIQSDYIQDHRMHEEFYDISEQAAEDLNDAMKSKKRIIAVGTTVIRTLESSFKNGAIQSGEGKTSLFISPGYQFKVIKGMITNFHLPKSSLLVLVSSFLSLEETKKAYVHAIESRYRFYSYGDAMFILK